MSRINGTTRIPRVNPYSFSRNGTSSSFVRSGGEGQNFKIIFATFSAEVDADAALRAGLEANPLLGDDYFVVEEEPLGERALALACAWVDRYVPEGLT